MFYEDGKKDTEAFALLHNALDWCRKYDLRAVVDLHILRSHHFNAKSRPLFTDAKAQESFYECWRKISSELYTYSNGWVAYELMNEPIAHYFDNKDELNKKLEPLYKRTVKAIREVDTNHVILLGGARWNSDFFMFADWKFDPNIMYTCHRYGGPATAEAIKDYIDFRDKTGLPMYMGETGHNTDEWQADLVRVMRDNNIGYTFWPYKKVDNSCMNAVVRPEGWDSVVVKFAEAQRTTFADIRAARPDQAEAWRILTQYLENVKFANCRPQASYIKSIGLKAE